VLVFLFLPANVLKVVRAAESSAVYGFGAVCEEACVGSVCVFEARDASSFYEDHATTGAPWLRDDASGSVVVSAEGFAEGAPMA